MVEAAGDAERSVTPAVENCQQQVQRILQSAAFRNASTLQQLFQFLTARALERRDSDPLKEYTIGLEAFGRPADFDPKTDTIVRVQMHRLRQRLRDYYDSEGRLDPVVVEIPRGYYLPKFEARSGVDADDRDIVGEEASNQLPSSPQSHPESRREGRIDLSLRLPRLKAVLLMGLLVAAALAVGIWIGANRKVVDTEGQPASIPSYRTGSDPVKAFWATFIGDDPNPVIAYPDAVFLLDNSNDLFRYRQGASDDRGASVDSHLAMQFASNPGLVSRAGALYYEYGYTGAGELQGVAMLSGLFGQMGIKPLVKPSRDLTAVDLRQHSVILMGSSFQNVAVAQLVTLGDFSFRNPDAKLEQWRAEILNARPAGPEQASYRTERDPATHVLKADYAIISIQPGLVPGRHIAVLGGLDTTGTEGATMYATSRNGVEEIQRGLGKSGGSAGNGDFPQFQAVVRVQLEKGYEVLGVSLAVLHKSTPSARRGTP